MAKNTRPRDTSANRSRKDKNPAFQRFGKSNGSFAGGHSAHYYRLKAKAKPGQVVHHKNYVHSQSTKGNLKALGGGKTQAARLKSGMALHNKQHPEKGRKAALARRNNRR